MSDLKIVRIGTNFLTKFGTNGKKWAKPRRTEVRVLMKSCKLLLTILVAISFASAANAIVTSFVYTNDLDGAISCELTELVGKGTSDVSARVEGNQYWGPGHMIGYFETDSPEDPTITFRTTVENDTGFIWWRYEVGVFLTQPFTISNIIVYTPSDWYVSYYTPNAIWNGTMYEGAVHLAAGTAIPGDPTDPGILDFSYKISFSGATSYGFVQEMTPIPEPATISLLAVGGLLCALGIRRLRQ